MNATGGNDWFWAPDVGGLMTVAGRGHASTSQDLEPKWTNFLLNCPPNRDGKLDPPRSSTLLRDVGAAWTPNPARPPLPAQPPQNERPYTPVSATATSGDADAAIDGKNDTDFISMWQPHRRAAAVDHAGSRARRSPTSAGSAVVPRYHHEKSSKDGNVTVVPDPHQHRRQHASARPPREPGRPTAG